MSLSLDQCQARVAELSAENPHAHFVKLVVFSGCSGAGSSCVANFIAQALGGGHDTSSSSSSSFPERSRFSDRQTQHASAVIRRVDVEEHLGDSVFEAGCIFFIILDVPSLLNTDGTPSSTGNDHLCRIVSPSFLPHIRILFLPVVSLFRSQIASIESAFAAVKCVQDYVRQGAPAAIQAQLEHNSSSSNRGASGLDPWFLVVGSKCGGGATVPGDDWTGLEELEVVSRYATASAASERVMLLPRGNHAGDARKLSALLQLMQNELVLHAEASATLLLFPSDKNKMRLPQLLVGADALQAQISKQKEDARAVEQAFAAAERTLEQAANQRKESIEKACKAEVENIRSAKLETLLCMGLCMAANGAAGGVRGHLEEQHQKGVAWDRELHQRMREEDEERERSEQEKRVYLAQGGSAAAAAALNRNNNNTNEAVDFSSGFPSTSRFITSSLRAGAHTAHYLHAEAAYAAGNQLLSNVAQQFKNQVLPCFRGQVGEALHVAKYNLDAALNLSKSRGVMLSQVPSFGGKAPDVLLLKNGSGLAAGGNWLGTAAQLEAELAASHKSNYLVQIKTHEACLGRDISAVKNANKYAGMQHIVETPVAGRANVGNASNAMRLPGGGSKVQSVVSTKELTRASNALHAGEGAAMLRGGRLRVLGKVVVSGAGKVLFVAGAAESVYRNGSALYNGEMGVGTALKEVAFDLTGVNLVKDLYSLAEKGLTVMVVEMHKDPALAQGVNVALSEAARM